MRRRKGPWVLVAVFCLGLAAGVWYVFGRWVPTNGKALLIRTVESNAPVSLAIGRLAYHPFRGLLAEDVVIASRDDGTVWLKSDRLQGSVEWLPLIAGRRADVRLHGPVSEPARAQARVSGTYDFRARTLRATVRADSLLLESSAPVLAKLLPQPPPQGTATLEADVRIGDHGLEIPRWSIASDAVQWSDARISVNAALNAEGSARPGPAGGPWNVTGRAKVRRGQVSGLPQLPPLTGLEGSMTFSPETLTVDELTGSVFASDWRLTGELQLRGAPHYEVYITSLAGLSELGQLAPELFRAWRPEGAAMLQAVCRGHTGLSRPDCLARADVRHAKLTGHGLPYPVTDISGNLAYDALTGTLAIPGLEAFILKKPLRAEGWVRFADEAVLDLRVKGTMLLILLNQVAAHQAKITDLGGIADVDLTVSGLMSSPRVLGRVDLQEARCTAAAVPEPFEQINGTVLLQSEAVVVQGVTMRWRDKPLRVDGTYSHQDSAPLIAATIEAPEGSLRFRTRLAAQRLVIEEAVLRLPRTRLTATGRLALTPAGESELQVNGQVALEELSRVPFVSLAPPEPWAPRGLVNVAGTWAGPWGAWWRGNAELRFSSQALEVHRVPLADVQGTFEQASSGFRIRIPAATLAGGRLTAEAMARPNGADYDVYAQADVTNLQLEALRELVPAWKGRDISGTASSHAMLTGRWQDRATWQGEGWVNASGRQLGQLPVLDRVLGGLFMTVGDWIGLSELRKAEVTGLACTWQMAENLVHSSDVRVDAQVGTEPLTVYAQGSVGLDGTLDLIVEPELSQQLLLDAEQTRNLSSMVLKTAGGLDRMRRLIGRHRLTGTIQQPKHQFEFRPEELIRRLLVPTPGLLENLFNFGGE